MYVEIEANSVKLIPESDWDQRCLDHLLSLERPQIQLVDDWRPNGPVVIQGQTKW